MTKRNLKVIESIGGEVPTNGGAETLSFSEPYTVRVVLTGTSDLIFHRWNAEAVDEKAKAAKGSKGKKSDNVESYVWRDDDGGLGIPGEYVRQSIIHAAKFRQDPRSPRKSAMDLYKAGVVSTTVLAPLGVETWDYLDTRRVQIQRSGINRTRPCMRAGWRCDMDFLVLLPEYIRPVDFQDVLTTAGKLVGIADFRPTYGRFSIASITFD